MEKKEEREGSAVLQDLRTFSARNYLSPVSVAAVAVVSESC